MKSGRLLPTKEGSFRLVPFTEEHGRQLCSWRYAPPYDVFHWTDSWEQMVEDGEEFGDEHIRDSQYRAVLDPKGIFVGFAQFFPLIGVTRLGFGLRPDLCGKGYGHGFVKAIIEEAKRRSATNQIDLEVLTWNERAIRTYVKAGFVLSDTYYRWTPSGESEFHCMVYQDSHIPT